MSNGETPSAAVLYVAVVDRPADRFRSRREHGDYAAFVGEDRDEVIQRALRARDEWGRDVYRVLVGVIDSEAREPVRFEVVPLAVNAVGTEVAEAAR
jgi:hypothetical protein